MKADGLASGMASPVMKTIGTKERNMKREELEEIFGTFAEKLANVCGEVKFDENETVGWDIAVKELSDYFAIFVSQTSILHALLKALHGDSASAELAMIIENAIHDNAEVRNFEALVNKSKIGS